MANRVIDVSGRRFGLLTVLSRAPQNIGDQAAWICACDCGATCVARSYQLRSGHIKSCGCATAAFISQARQKDIRGQVFGRLTAIHRVDSRRWLCACACGNSAVVLTDNLKPGGTKSCGCYARETRVARGKQSSFRDSPSRFRGKPDHASRLTTLYLAEVNGRLLKVGITSYLNMRASKAFTGIHYQREMPRAICWATEKAALWETRAHELTQYPDWLTLRCGRTELRQGLDVTRTIELLDRLADRCEAIGWEAFWEELEAKQRLET